MHEAILERDYVEHGRSVFLTLVDLGQWAGIDYNYRGLGLTEIRTSSVAERHLQRSF